MDEWFLNFCEIQKVHMLGRLSLALGSLVVKVCGCPKYSFVMVFGCGLLGALVSLVADGKFFSNDLKS